MKWNNLSCLFLVLLVLSFTACEPATNEPPKVSDFRRGFDGVEFDFQPNRPPDRLFEGDTVPLSLSIQNRGAATITKENPVTVVAVLDDFYFDFSGAARNNLAYSEELLGKSIDYPHGQSANELIVGALSAKKLLGQIESPETKIFVNICYPYQTVFYTVACINSDVYYSDERQEICHTEEINSHEGQGAPIAITKIIPRISLIEDTNGPRPAGRDGVLANTAYQVVKPVFEIHIENKNDGIPYYLGNDDVKKFCELNDIDRKTQVNKVRISATLDASDNDAGILDCDVMNPSNNYAVVSLRNNKGVIYCMPPNDQTITAEYNYFAQISVTADYVYSEGKIKQLEVVRKQFG